MAARPYSESTAELVDSEVQRIIQDCWSSRQALLQEHWEALEQLPQELISRNHCDCSNQHPKPSALRRVNLGSRSCGVGTLSTASCVVPRSAAQCPCRTDRNRAEPHL